MRGVLLWSVSRTKKNAPGTVIVIFDFANGGDLDFGKGILSSQGFQKLLAGPLRVPTSREVHEKNRSQEGCYGHGGKRDAFPAGQLGWRRRWDSAPGFSFVSRGAMHSCKSFAGGPE